MTMIGRQACPACSKTLTSQVRHKILRRTSKTSRPGNQAARKADSRVSQMWSVMSHAQVMGPPL